MASRRDGHQHMRTHTSFPVLPLWLLQMPPPQTSCSVLLAGLLTVTGYPTWSSSPGPPMPCWPPLS